MTSLSFWHQIQTCPEKSDMDGCSEFKKTCCLWCFADQGHELKEKKSESMNLLFVNCECSMLYCWTLEKSKRTSIDGKVVQAGHAWSLSIGFSLKSTLPDLLVIRLFNGFVWSCLHFHKIRIILWRPSSLWSRNGQQWSRQFPKCFQKCMILGKATTCKYWPGLNYWFFCIPYQYLQLYVAMFHQDTVPSIISCDMQLRTLLSDAPTFWCVLLCSICFPEQHSTCLRILQTLTSTDPHQHHKASSVLSFEGGAASGGKRSRISCCSVLSLSRSCQPVKSADPMCRRICPKENHYVQRYKKS